MSVEKQPIVGEIVTSDQQPEYNPPTVRQDDAGTLAAILGVGSVLEFNNFDGDDMARWKLSALATDGEAVRKEDCIGKIIDVKYIYIHVIQLADAKTGEVTDSPRTVLIDADGKAYAFVSSGIAMAAARMFMTFGRKPFVPAVKMQVKEITTRSRFKMLTMVPA